MLMLPPSVRVFLIVEPANMLGSFDSLAGKVRALGLEPTDGHLYLFLSKRRHMVKILCFDHTGWCIWQKRLERGSFQIPVIPPGASRVRMDIASLSALLEGLDLRAPRRKWYRQTLNSS